MGLSEVLEGDSFVLEETEEVDVEDDEGEDEGELEECLSAEQSWTESTRWAKQYDFLQPEQRNGKKSNCWQ